MMNTIFKNLSLILIILFVIGCEEDDVCIGEASPNWVVKIKNQQTQLADTLDTLYVEYRDSDDVLDTLKLYQVDSFQVPLRIDGGAIGFGFISSLQDDAVKDSISMNYESEEEYVSKACGLKKVFKNVSYIEHSLDSIQSIESLTPQISNDDEVHIVLYY